MSIHSSLRGGKNLVGERSVLPRGERLQILVKKGTLDAKTGSAYRLPKVRTRFKVAGAKKAPKPAAAGVPGAPGAAPAAGAPAAAPAAGAKPAAAAPAKEAAPKKNWSGRRAQ